MLMDTEFLSGGMKIFSNQIVMMFEQSHESTKKKKIWTVCLFFLAVPHDLWYLSSPTRGWTQARAVKSQNPNH